MASSSKATEEPSPKASMSATNPSLPMRLSSEVEATTTTPFTALALRPKFAHRASQVSNSKQITAHHSPSLSITKAPSSPPKTSEQSHPQPAQNNIPLSDTSINAERSKAKSTSAPHAAQTEELEELQRTIDERRRQWDERWMRAEKLSEEYRRESRQRLKRLDAKMARRVEARRMRLDLWLRDNEIRWPFGRLAGR